MVATDITETIMQNLPVAILVHAPDTSIVSANAKALELLGLDEGEIRGKQIEDAGWHLLSREGCSLPLEDHPAARVIADQKPLSNLMAGIKTRGTGDRVIWALFNAAPVWAEDGSLSEVVVTFVDVTSLKQAGETQQTCQDGYRTFVENFKGITFRLSLDFRPIFFHGAVEEITGYPEEAFLTGHPAWEQIIHPEDRGPFPAGMTGEPGDTAGREYRIVRKDGATGWVREVPGRIREETGAESYIQGTIYDISEKKQAELSLNKRLVELTALNAVTQLVHAGMSQEEMVRGVIKGLSESLAPDLAILYLLEGREMVIQGIYTHNLDFPKAEDMRHEFGQCLCGLTAESGVSVFSLNIHADPRCTHPECKAAGLTSYAAMPLRMDGRVIGVIGLGSKKERDFSEHREFIESLAAVISTGFHKVRLFENMAQHAGELEERVRERTRDLKEANQKLEKDVEQRKRAEKTIRKNEMRLQSLINIGLMKDATEKELIEYAVDELVNLTDSEIGYLHFVDSGQSQVTLFAWSQKVLQDCSAPNSALLPLSEAGMWADCMRDRRPVIHNDYPNMPFKTGTPPGHLPITRHMSIPVMDGETIVALAGVGNKMEPYDEIDALQLSLFTSKLWDTIKQKRREEEIKQLLSAVERSPASIVITDKNAQITYVNPFFTQITGYTDQEAIGQNPRILKSGYHDQAFYRQMWETLESGQTWRGEYCNRTKDGRIYWEDASIAPVFDEKGMIKYYIAVKEDITTRKKYEEELKTALSEFETIFNNSSVAIAYFKQDRIIYRVNERFTQLFRCTQEEMVGKSAEVIHISHENYLDFGKKYVKNLIHGGVIQTEYQMRRMDGVVIWCYLYGKAINPPRLKDGVIWVLDDITERKELEMLREDVDRIMRHDLKTPLNGIIGLPQVMMTDENLTEEQIEFLQLIEESGYRMLHQINLSLDLFKMEIGQYHFLPKPVDFNKIISRLLKELTPGAGAKGIGTRAYVKGTPINQAKPFIVQADEMLSFTMLSNLLNNAIEASSMGEQILIDLDEEGDRAYVSIHNSNAVPESIRDQFFDKYSTYGKEKGTGLGTYSAKLMAETQGGAIHFVTSEESGTTVTVCLPK